ncbi:MAG: beta-lactamase family protein, partial [Clostridia bacterium]|nr:beta-lactamase family protein [Clostridia bacterium]
MSFEQIVRDLERLNVNLYRFAFYTPENGVRVHEFRPCSRCCNSYSVAKAFLVSAIGLLQDDGLLRVEDSIAAYLGDAFPANIDPRWHQATIEHAMTHRLGFDEGFLDIDTEDVSLYHTDDYLQIVLQHPLAHAPGTHYQYSDAAYYLL